MKPKEYDLAKYEVTRELPEEHLALYAQDDFKYLIHVLRTDPSDPFRILQFLTVRFYPLLVSTCGKYSKSGLKGSWLDLISQAKTRFVILVYQFKLDGTLYFRQYITTALDRYFCTYLSYIIKRKSVLDTISINTAYQQNIMRVLEHDGEESIEGNLRDEPVNYLLAECKFFVAKVYGESSTEYEVFTLHFFHKEPVGLLAEMFGVSSHQVRKIHKEIILQLKVHIPLFLEKADS